MRTAAKPTDTQMTYCPAHYCAVREVALRRSEVRRRIHSYLGHSTLPPAVHLWVGRILGPYSHSPCDDDGRSESTRAATAAAAATTTAAARATAATATDLDTVLLFTHDAMTEHALEDHPEKPERLVALIRALTRARRAEGGVKSVGKGSKGTGGGYGHMPMPRRHAPMATAAELCLVHFVDYVNQVSQGTNRH
jgi:hypothetical protein